MRLISFSRIALRKKEKTGRTKRLWYLTKAVFFTPEKSLKNFFGAGLN